MTTNKGGRPRAFNSVEELEKAIEKYYKECEKKKKPRTMGGLAVACGVDRRTLVNYSDKEEYFLTIQKHRAIVEADMEEGALMGKLNPTFTIFSLKNNFGWKDKQEIEQTLTNFDIEIG